MKKERVRWKSDMARRLVGTSPLALASWFVKGGPSTDIARAAFGSSWLLTPSSSDLAEEKAAICQRR